MTKGIDRTILEYRYHEKNYEFLIDGVVKEKDKNIHALVQKVKKHKLSYEFEKEKK